MVDDNLQLSAREPHGRVVETNYDGVVQFIGELIDELDKVYGQLMFEANRDGRLLKGMSKRDREIDQLKHKISKLKAREKQLEAEVQKLKSTKGYKLQQRYWRLRKATGK